jgi:hypothetical protein
LAQPVLVSLMVAAIEGTETVVPFPPILRMLHHAQPRVQGGAVSRTREIELGDDIHVSAHQLFTHHATTGHRHQGPQAPVLALPADDAGDIRARHERLEPPRDLREFLSAGYAVSLDSKACQLDHAPGC